MSVQKIQAISLDAMGTLIFLRESVGKTYYKLLEKHNITALNLQLKQLSQDPKVFRKLWKKAEKDLPFKVRQSHLDRYHVSEQNPISFWQILFKVLFQEFSLPFEKMPLLLDDALQEFSVAKNWYIEPSFFILRDYCQEKNISLLVTSNFDNRLPLLLKDLQIEKSFQKILYSSQIGYEKPSQKIFDKLKDITEALPQKILHIGDTWSADVEGALQAKMQVAFYNPQKKKLSKQNVFDIQRLSQVIDLLQ